MRSTREVDRSGACRLIGAFAGDGGGVQCLIKLIERRAAVWQVGTRAGRDVVAPTAVGQAA
jgi:hypothetical protein